MNVKQEIEKRAKEIIRVKRRVFILEMIGKGKKSVVQECEEFGIPRSSYYEWKKRYESEGEEGLKKKKPIANNHPRKIKEEVVERVIELRKEYQLGSKRITWYLERYNDINIS